MEKRLLTIEQAANLLNVSKTTFGKIRREAGLSEIMVGKRPRFLESELLAALPRATHQRQSSAGPTSSSRNETSAETNLNLRCPHDLSAIETELNKFDLTRIRRPDPFGAVSLLCAILNRVRSGHEVEILVDNGPGCQILKSFHFFYHLESLGEGKVNWDRRRLSEESFRDANRLVPIRAVRARGGEKRLTVEIAQSLKDQGFSEEFGGFIGDIVAELVLNAMTHSDANLSDRVCFVSAQRSELQGEKDVILGVADLGKGIQSGIRRKFAGIPESDTLMQAFLVHEKMAYDKRDLSLIDVLGFVAGNHGRLRLDDGDLGLSFDFRESPRMEGRAPLARTSGSRFGLILRDRNFHRYQRAEVYRLLRNLREREVSSVA